MSPEERRLFGCPICGFKVTGGEQECHRCGSRFSSDTRFECPFCGSLVDRSATACPDCHISYVDFVRKAEARTGGGNIDALLEEIILMEASEVKREDRRFSCPVCAWMLSGSEEKCPKCGASFLADVSFQCPVCAATVGADTTRCPECGTIFAEEGEPTPEERAARIGEAVSALDEFARGMTSAEAEESQIELHEPAGPEEQEERPAPAAVGAPPAEEVAAPERREEEAPAGTPPKPPQKPKTSGALKGAKQRKLKAKSTGAVTRAKTSPKAEEKQKKKGDFEHR